MDQILIVIQEMVGSKLQHVSCYMLCLCEKYLVIGRHHFQQLLLYHVSKVVLFKTCRVCMEPPIKFHQERTFSSSIVLIYGQAMYECIQYEYRSVGCMIPVAVTMGYNPVQSSRYLLMCQRNVRLMSSDSKSKPIRSTTSTHQVLLDHKVLYPRW